MTLHDYASYRVLEVAKGLDEIGKAGNLDTATRAARAVASGLEAFSRSPEELARARRSTRARIALGTLGGATVIGGTAGMATSLGNRLGPAKRVKIVGAKTPADKDNANRTVHSKAMTNRDQNSSVPVSTSRRGVASSHKTGTVTAKPRRVMEPKSSLPAFATRDQNSSPGSRRVATPSLRSGPHIYDEGRLKVVRRTSSHPGDSRVQVYGKAARGVKRSLDMIARSKPSLTTRIDASQGKLRGQLTRGAAQNSASVDLVHATKPYGSGNVRFGSTPTRGRRLP